MLSAAIALDECKQLVQSLHQWRLTERAKESPAFSAWGGIGASFTPLRISHMCEGGLYFSHETDHHGQAETAYGCSFVFVFRLSFYNVSRKGFTALFRSYRRVSTARKE